jgi:hypothetical protein
VALVVALSGVTIWWYSGAPAQQLETPVRQEASPPLRQEAGPAPAVVQNPSPTIVQEPRAQVEVEGPARRTVAPRTEPIAQQVRPAGRAAADPPPVAVETASALNALRDDYDNLSIRGGAIDDTLNQLWEDMKPASPRVDMVTHQRSLKTNLTRSKDAIAEKDAAGARKYLDIARGDLEALEQFLNR